MPSVAPTLDLPDDYQRVTNKVGGALQQAGDQAFKAGQLFDQVAADDAINQLQERGNKLFYGTGQTSIGPDGQPIEDTGYFGTVGRSALDGRPVVEQNLDGLIKEIRSGLKSPMQLAAFESAASRYKNAMNVQTSNHADTQAKTWYNTVASASEQNALTAISNDPLNPVIFANNATELINAKTKQAQLAGASPGDEVWTAAISEGKRQALTAQVMAVGVNDPERALQILDKNRNIAGTAYDEMYNALDNKRDQQVGLAFGGDAWAQASTSAKTADATSYANPQLPVYQQAAQEVPGGMSAAGLARTVMIESRGDPKATNASGHVGLGQFSDSTAAEVGITDRADPDQSIYGIQKYAARNAATLARVLGRQPTDAELYLAHQQGPGGASALLRNPTGLASDAIGLKTVEANLPASERDRAAHLTSAQFMAIWTNKFNGTSVPTGPLGQPPVIQPVVVGGQSQANPDIFSIENQAAAPQSQPGAAPEAPEAAPLPSDYIRAGDEPVPVPPKAAAYQAIMADTTLTPKQREIALSHINQLASAEAIAANETAAAKKAAEDTAFNGYVTNMLTGQTQGLLQKIAVDPNLSGEKKIYLTNAIQADAQKSVAGATASYGEGFWPALQQINAAPGDAGRIFSVDQLMKLTMPGPNGEAPSLTLAGFQQLGTMLQASQKQPDQAAVSATINSMLTGVKKKLSFERAPTSQFDPGEKDPQGEEIFNTVFLPKFWSAYNDWTVKQGKDPWEFLTRENMETLAEGLRSPQEMAMKRMLANATGLDTAQMTAPPAPAGVDQDAWTTVFNARPVNPNDGKPLPDANWFGILQTMIADPSPRTTLWFDKHFAGSGLTAADVLAVLGVAPMEPEVAHPDRADTIRRITEGQSLNGG